MRPPAANPKPVWQSRQKASWEWQATHSGDWPYTEELTAGFVYLRLHGSPKTYASRYSRKEIERLAGRIQVWLSGGEPRDARRISGRVPPRRTSRDVYVYLDNDHRGYAPANAPELTQRLRAVPSGDR